MEWNKRTHTYFRQRRVCVCVCVGCSSFHSVVSFAAANAAAVAAALRFCWRLTGYICVFMTTLVSIFPRICFSPLLLLWFTKFNGLILRYICGRYICFFVLFSFHVFRVFSSLFLPECVCFHGVPFLFHCFCSVSSASS